MRTVKVEQLAPDDEDSDRSPVREVLFQLDEGVTRTVVSTSADPGFDEI